MHYIAYFSLIFRANRIFRIMSIEAVFLDEIYDFSHLVNKNDPGKLQDLSHSVSIDDSPLIKPILNENSDVLSYE